MCTHLQNHPSVYPHVTDTPNNTEEGLLQQHGKDWLTHNYSSKIFPLNVGANDLSFLTKYIIPFILNDNLWLLLINDQSPCALELATTFMLYRMNYRFVSRFFFSGHMNNIEIKIRAVYLFEKKMYFLHQNIHFQPEKSKSWCHDSGLVCSQQKCFLLSREQGYLYSWVWR